MLRDYFVTEDGVSPWGMWRGLAYRTWSKFIHRFDYHRTRRSLLPDGCTIHRCDWCGVSRKETPMWLIEQRMRDACSKL